jgi:hypothetical protein
MSPRHARLAVVRPEGRPSPSGRRGAPVAVVVLVALAAAVGARPAVAASPGEDLLARWIAAAEADGFTVSVGDKRYDAGRDRIDWTDISFANRSGWRARIGSAGIEALAETDGALSVRLAELRDLSVADADGRLDVGAVTLRDGRLPDLSGLADVPTPDLAGIKALFARTAAVRLGFASAERIRLDVPQTSGRADDGGDGRGKGRVSISLGRVVADGLGDNRLASAVAGPLSVTSPEAKGVALLDVESLRLGAIDLGVVADFFDPDRYPNGRGDGVWRDIVGEVSLSGLGFDGPGVRLRLGRYGFNGLALRRVDAAPLDLIAPEKPEMTPGNAEKLLTLLSSVRIGRYGLQGLAVEVSGTGVNDGRFALDVHDVTDLSLDGLGGYRLGGLSAAFEGAEVALGEFRIGEIGFPKPEAILALIRDPDGVMRTDLLPRVGLVRIAGLMVKPGGRAAAGKPVSLDLAELRQSDFLGGVPTRVAFTLAGLGLPADLPDPKWRGALAELGYDALSLGGEIRLGYDAERSTLTLDALSLALDKGGRLEAAATITGVSPDLLQAPDRLEDYIGEIGFGAARAAYQDQSLVDRLLDVAARQQKVTREVFKARMAALVPALAAQIADPQMRAAIAQAVAAFIVRPGALEVVAEPPAPVPAVQVLATIAANPWRLVDIFRLTVNQR